jgi:hypothetical protein
MTSCTGHQELANSTYILFPPYRGTRPTAFRVNEAKAGEPSMMTTERGQSTGRFPRRRNSMKL